jgi:hypothetical protein
MPQVTSFESGTPEQELAQGAAGKFDYGQVEAALKNNFTVAENVFARCAKHHFRKRLGDRVQLHDPETTLLSPIWSVGASVTLSFVGKLDTSKLEELTETLVVAVLKVRDGEKLLLVDPFSTKIIQVGTNLFTFTVKQMWSFDAR